MAERKNNGLSGKDEREARRGLYKRGNIWWIRYAGPDGRMRYESSESAYIRKAQELLAEKRKEVAEGRDPKPVRRGKGYLFKDLAGEYLVWAEQQKSFRRKRGFIKKLVSEFGNVPLNSFSTRIVERYQESIKADGRSNATANRHLATLKHMFTKAVDWEIAGEDTLKKIRKVKLLPEKSRMRYLTEEEAQDLVNACKPHLQPIVVTALNTGMRKEEILSLQWDRNIDLRNRLILLEDTKNNQRREIPINGAMLSTLQGLQRRLDSPFVFCNEKGKRHVDIKRAWELALRKAGIKDFRFHDLRHTCASHLIMAGVDLKTVQDLLGHKDIKMTLRYAHLSPGHRAVAVERLSQIFGGPTIQKTIQFAQSTKKERQP